MKFTADRGDLLAALDIVLRAGGKNVELDVSTDRITLSCHSGEVSITTPIAPASLEVEPGTPLVTGRLFRDVVTRMPKGPVNVELEDHLRIVVTGGRTKLSIVTLGAAANAMFGRLAHIDPTSYVDAGELRRLISHVRHAASTDTARPTLCGIHLSQVDGRLLAAATDSYRLAVGTIELRGSELLDDVILLSTGLTTALELLEADELGVATNGNAASFTDGSTSVSFRRIEDRFPNWRQLVPSKLPRMATFDAEELVEAIRTVKLFAKNADPVRLIFGTDGTVELLAISQDVGEGSVTIDVETDWGGDGFRVAFNPDYLAEVVQGVGTPKITLNMVDALKPAVCRPVDGDFDTFGLLMPVRVP